DIIRALDCPRKIGLCLNQSLLMSPSKSVTALVGLGGSAGDAPVPQNNCAGCAKINCTFREKP
ncbi:MAG: Vitamin B12 dependent methionine synthase activation subunit, partial [Clostridia bacterium]|nr:Vitamin B12 dependent methionine synthase activation subunit [Clostridia bacterium]